MDYLQHKQFKILLIGDSCIDIFHYGSCDRISPEAPVPIFNLKYSNIYEGMCLNVKNNLIKMGCEVKTIHDKNKTTKERYIDIKSKQHVLRVDKEVKNKTSFSIPKNFNFEDYDAIVISDYDKGFLTSKNIKNLLSLLSVKSNIPVFADSKKRELDCFKNVIIKINDTENKNMIRPPVNCDLIVTHGPEGAEWNNNKYDTEKAEVCDVSGAGDSFLAGLVVGYLLNNDIGKAIKHANVCGNISVQKSGTYAVSIEDIREYYAKKL
jgi:D-beta-D-heptose 7-phosphate kinase/D-beta-D-heptose 1-phosphate adenosyltransferase